MRILVVSLVIACAACAEQPTPVHSSAKVETKTAAPAVQEADSVASQTPTVAVEPKVEPTTPAPAPMDTVSMEEQVKAAFASNAQISPARSEQLSGTTMALIQAANSGDQAAVSNLSGKLLKQALLGGGFGLVDIAGIVQAIQDLIAAAANADVAGILKALQDIAAAVTA